jgi:hypothetical protein
LGRGGLISIIHSALIRSPSLKRCALWALAPALLVSAVSVAQPAGQVEARATSASNAVGELGTVRLRYGVALRQGSQTDLGPGLSYSGLTPNDVALSATWFGVGHLGGVLSLQREGFALNDDAQVRVTQGSLLRVHAGPSGRLALGPARLEALVGYQFAQLPAFGDSAAPGFSAAQRHSALLASRVLVDLPLGMRAEGRFEYPLALSTKGPGGAAASSSGLAGGASLSVPLGNAKTLVYGVLLDYQYVSDRLEVASLSQTSNQSLQRLGVALELKWLDKPPPPKYGSVWVLALDEKGQPLPKAEVVLSQGGHQRKLVTGDDGRARAEDWKPGAVQAQVNASDFVPQEAQATVVAGQEAGMEVRLKRVPPKVGGLLVALVVKDSKAPVAGATVNVRGTDYTTDAEGRVNIGELPVGPVQVKVMDPEFHPVTEVASVVFQKTSEVPLELVELRKKIPATITGLVRSTRGGPVSADLELPEAKAKTKAGKNGSFSFTVTAGTYRVIISAPGFVTQRKSVTVKEGDQAILNVDLYPEKRRR